jgi:hypothetical protein
MTWCIFTLSYLQLRVNLVRQHIRAHYAYVFVNKLIHVDGINVAVKRAQKTR